MRQPRRRRQAPNSTLTILRSPTNNVACLTHAFVHAMEIKDPSYDISSYIPFWTLLPQRLGSDGVLDASIDAVTVAHRSIRTNMPLTEVYTKYGHALKTLRISLNDPTKTATLETLTAIYLMMILQEWIDGDNTSGGYYGHASILVHILNTATYQKWTGDFEVELLFTIALPVLLSSIFNPKISLEPWFPRLLITEKVIRAQPCKVDGKEIAVTGETVSKFDEFVPIPALELRNLGRVSVAMQDPQANRSEIYALQQLVRADCGKTRELLDEAMELSSTLINNTDSQLEPIDRPVLELVRYYQTAHGLTFGLALLMTSVLLVVDPFEERLVKENNAYCAEIIDFGRYMSRYRPLGASFIPPLLAMVVALSEDKGKRMDAEDLLTKYSTDFKGARWRRSASWLRSNFQKLRVTIAQKRPPETAFKNAGPEFEDFRTPPADSCYIQ